VLELEPFHRGPVRVDRLAPRADLLAVRATALAAMQVERVIARDAREPRPDSAMSRRRFERGHERALRDLLGVRAPADERAREAQDELLVVEQSFGVQGRGGIHCGLLCTAGIRAGDGAGARALRRSRKTCESGLQGGSGAFLTSSVAT
jgi:hypothetical protein